MISPLLRAGLDRWISHGIPPGDFLVAVLCNDLNGAVRRADSENIQHLPEIVNWLREHAPLTSWGSPQAVQRWKLSRQRLIKMSSRTAEREDLQ
jgi:hypothetical protein